MEYSEDKQFTYLLSTGKTFSVYQSAVAWTGAVLIRVALMPVA